MKRYLCLWLMICTVLILTSCSTANNQSTESIKATESITTEPAETEPISEKQYTALPCSKDGVEQLFAALDTEEVKLDGLLQGMNLNADNCYNVTPKSVAEQTDIQIFKFSDSCVSVALIDGELYEICNYFGGYGFVNAEAWDYDADGNLDLLIAASWGSGIHRTEITVFNTATKKSVSVCNSLITDFGGQDLIVLPDANPQRFQIVSVDIGLKGNDMQGCHLANLAYFPKKTVGYIYLGDSGNFAVENAENARLEVEPAEKIVNVDTYLYKTDSDSALLTLQSDFLYALNIPQFGSCFAHGSYEETDDMVILKSENNTYAFQKVGQNLAFDAKKSSPMPNYIDSSDPQGKECVPDGAVFELLKTTYVGAYDWIDYDVDNDGKREQLTLGYGYTSGRFSFTLKISENGIKEYENVFSANHCELSFEEIDGKLKVKAVLPDEPQKVGYFDIILEGENIWLQQDGVDIGQWSN